MSRPLSDIGTLVDYHAGATSPSAPRSGPPNRIGRYVVLSKLGAGAMGVVYSAYDEELDRRVAIKLVRAAAGERPESGLRMVREAQALAKLSHPHVVHVYEVGEFGDQTYLVMEFILGQTLRAWLQRSLHPWREVLRVLVQAGRGLAAAHASGLVHRDFKPDNVLVGSDGRARVLDFGLARGDFDPNEPLVAEREVPPASRPDHSTSSSGWSFSRWHSIQLTRDGAVIGTPAYMSPEQFAGRPADARSDQFGFCVTLYEALYGIRPFRGDTLDDLRNHVMRDRPTPPPRSSGVHPRIFRLLSRGLAVAPADRWPTLDLLLDALEHDPTRVGRRVAGFIASLGLVAGTSYAFAAQRELVAEQCRGAGEEVAQVWPPERAQRVQQAIERTATPLSADTAVRVRTMLHDYALRWITASTETCETHRDGKQSDALFDLRMSCLKQRKSAFAGTVALLLEADAEIVQHAVQSVTALPSIERCADVEALQASSPPSDDPRTARALAVLRERVDALEVLARAGRYRQALQLSEDLLRAAEPLRDLPLLARLHLQRGSLRMELESHREAADELRQAAATALEVDDPTLAAESLARWIFESGVWLGRTEAALEVQDLAAALARRAGDASKHLTALLRNNVGVVLQTRGEFSEALVALQDACDLWRDLPAHKLDLAAGLMNHGMVLRDLGRFTEARVQLERSAQIFTDALGPHHPRVSYPLLNLGLLLVSAGDFAAARPHLERALSIVRPTLGPDHVLAAYILAGLGAAARGQGDLVEAEQQLARAVEVWQRQPHEPADAGGTYVELARVELRRGRLGEAERQLRHVLALYETELGPESPQLFHPLVRLVELHLRRGALAEAQAAADRALALGSDERSSAQADLQFLLAQLRWETPEARAGAREHARAAREFFLSLGPGSADALRDVDTWLTGHPEPSH